MSSSASAMPSAPLAKGAAASPARAEAAVPGHPEPVRLEGLALGIDVGGTGVKAAIVDLASAELVTSRVREKTPQPSTPEAVLETMASVVEQVLAEHAQAEGMPVGCGLPGPIKGGVMKTAANLDQGWVDYHAGEGLSARLGRQVHVINDADAAGMAELAYGEARGKAGTIILLTVGTGIGSALISDGRLVPNTEFGHLVMRRKASETLVSGAARTRRGLGWKRWAREFNEYLAMIDLFFWPDLIILGGGVSKESKKYWKYLEAKAPIVGARFLNTSGIIGAAYAAGLAAREASLAAEAAEASGRVRGAVADGRRARRRSARGDRATDASRSAGGRPSTAVASPSRG